MKKQALGTMTLLLGTTALSCDGESGDAPEDEVREFTIAQSCAETDASLCYDNGASEDISDCTAFGGTVLESACPTEGRVGSCHFALEDKIVRYYEGETAELGWTNDTARSNCNAGPFIED